MTEALTRVSRLVGISEHGCVLRWGGEPGLIPKASADAGANQPVFELLYKGSDPSTIKVLEAKLDEAYQQALAQFAEPLPL
ncbi:MAG: hypothetical protein VKJ06_04785 [Vampirovibrionales bacterium]|nr:hypothetical protein [Vampirovibrionales bacterium]